MSFFGFDPSLPCDRPGNSGAPAFRQAPDPFAGLSGGGAGNTDDDALDFEDTYDGLGDQLDETDDVLNDDTFGAGPEPQTNVGKDFDFSGQTARYADTLQEEQMLFSARQRPPKALSPPKQVAKPARSGYEKYADPTYIPQLEANADIWGLGPKKQGSEPQPHLRQESQSFAPAPSRKMMSLEEVEAALRAQRQAAAAAPQVPQPGSGGMPFPHQNMGMPQQGPQMPMHAPPGFPSGGTIMHPDQQRHAFSPPELRGDMFSQMPPLQHMNQGQRQQYHGPPGGYPNFPAGLEQRASLQPVQILQNPNRASGGTQATGNVPGIPQQPPPPRQMQQNMGHNRGPSMGGPIVTHPEQLLGLSEGDRAAFLLEDAKRAKRNHKIHLLSKDNGLMTPQDKNFITRIQLQQLLTATGTVDNQGPEGNINEDFYYLVHSQIRGAPRQNPHQPLSQFAQTYLLQTGGRHGGRHRYRGGENHMQRMEQQVQRAVEAAKLKPKNKQLVIEGSLGKISFSNSKTPKPLLSFKRAESGDPRPQSQRTLKPTSIADRKTTLKDLENVYGTLMKLEDHERRMPPPVDENSSPDAIHDHMQWTRTVEELNQRLWRELKVMEPIIPNSPTPHPFIAILSHSKGKKAIPRIFRHLDEQQRVTILTMIVVQLDMLDVIRLAYPTPEEPVPSRTVRDEIELFAKTVIPSIFGYVEQAPMNIVIGLMGLVVSRVNVQAIIRTKIGVSVLTAFLSRAELAKQAGSAQESELNDWNNLYNQLFDLAEPVLPYIFPNTMNSEEDRYIWQFLAAMGLDANQEQQQRLVIGVKDRVMETVTVSKTLPPDMAEQRLGNVNLFMRAIGLDVELLG